MLFAPQIDITDEARAACRLTRVDYADALRGTTG
jgi:hypothetical protein